MSQTTPQAIHLCHELLGWLIPLLDKFPRSRRFSIGDRLESALLDVLERLVEAAYTRAIQKTSFSLLVQSWIGHAKHADMSRLRRAIFLK